MNKAQQDIGSNLSTDGWITQVRAALLSTLVLVIIVSGIYPLIVWAMSQLMFPHQANGSLIYASDGKTVIGSELLSQPFTGEKYFHSRPSAAGSGHDPSSSGGTNLGPTSDKLLNGIADDPSTTDVDESYSGVKQLIEGYRATNGLASDATVPADAVTRSASGVDPHISPANAQLQTARVARARGMNEGDVQKLIDQQTSHSQLGLFGEPRVNVLMLNRALDNAQAKN
ncbi:MAG TPA: K(+)-transporting ATPase subunit C [Tepidisphaeraceae bacterium]|nr:K(+)-transporting ATPase subunit C [Tepidisphaeraceae bacterium]